MAVLLVDEHGRRTRAVRLTFDPKTKCPAAVAIHESPEGAGVRCMVERNTISSLRDPSSLMTYCLCDYSACPSWHLEKQRIEGGGALELLDRPDPDRTAGERMRELGGSIEYEPIEYTDYIA